MATEPLIILVDEKGARVVKKRIDAIGRSAQKAGAGVNILKRVLVTLGAGLLLRGVVKKIAEFEQALSTVQAVTRATDVVMQQLTDTARDLGATTRFTATQAAEGLVFLSRAGFSANEALAAIPDTLFLAQAGALDLASAADITASTIRGFRIEATEAGRVADVLALAANSANTNVFELGESIKFVAPVAAGLGVSLEEAVAALQQLADAGLKGTLAGTGLRRVLAELESPGATALKIFRTLGIETDKVRVSQVGLTAALDELNRAGVDAGQALEIFGQRGGPAFLVLQNNIPNIKAANAALLDSGGTAREVARIMDENLNGALLRVKSAFEAVVLSFGEIGASTFLQNFLNNLASVLRIVANNMEVAAVATLGLAIVLGRDLAGRAIKAAISGLIRLNVALLSNPFTAIAVAITTVIALLVKFRNDIRITGTEVTSIGDLAKATLEFLGSALAGFVQFFKDELGPVVDVLKSIFPEFELSLTGVLRSMAQALDGIIGVIEGVVVVIIEIFTGLGPALKEIFFDVFNDLTERVEKSINVIIDAINSVSGFVGIDPIALVDLGRLENTAEGAGKALGDGISKGFVDSVLRTDVQDALEGVLKRAEDLGIERVAADAATLDLGGDAPKLGDDGGGADSAGFSIGPIVADLEQQQRLLRLTSSEREIQNELLRIESQLKRDLTKDERGLITEQLESIRTTELVSDALADLRGEEIDLVAVQEELNLRLADGSITAEEFEKALRSLELQAIETDKSLGAGLSRGLQAIKDDITDVAGAMEDLLVNAFKSAEDALVEFVQTGTVDFKKFVDSLLEDLTRLIIKQTILNLVSGTAGGVGGGLLGLAAIAGVGAAAGGAFQAGGFAKAGEPILVGEKGPEIFSPTQSGRVIPNSAISAEPPQVNVTVVNVTDPNDAVAAINTPDGERAIVNVIRRQRRGVQQILG